MAKLSILLVLALGVLFAQTISVEMVMKSDDENEDSDDEYENTNDNSNNAASNLEEVDSDSVDKSTDDPESPTLTCLLFGELGCSTKCSIAAQAFSTQGTGQCTGQNVCQCTVQRQSLDNLLRAKFLISKRLMEKIKSEKKLAAKVLKVLQKKPFQTAEQIKTQLKDNVDLGIYNQLYPSNQNLAFKLEMIDEMGIPDSDIVKSFVKEKVKPVLETSANTLKGIDYKSKLTDAVKNNASNSEDVQSIMAAVRGSENRSLITALNAFVRTNRKIKQIYTNKIDSIVEVIDYYTVDQFVKYIDELNKPPPKKPVRKQTSRTTAGNKRSNSQGKETTKQPVSVEIPSTELQKPTEETSKKEDSDESADNRFQLSDIDQNFAKKTIGTLDKTFTTDEYTVQYQRDSKGDIHFTWKKGNDKVEMSINARGTNTSINQVWRLGNAKINLGLASRSDKTQVWNFGNSKYEYNSKTGRGVWSKGMSAGKKSELKETLQKHKDLIAEWCDKNLFLVGEKDDCIIY